jgi:hypothetical protein
MVMRNARPAATVVREETGGMVHESNRIARFVEHAMSVRSNYTPFWGVGNRCARAGPPGAAMTQPTFGQAVVHEACKLLAKTGNTDRGLLVNASTGSGKLCSCVAAIDAFWDTDRRFLYVCTSEGLQQNGLKEFLACCSMFKRVRPEALASRLTFMTFAQLAHKLGVHRGLKYATDRELLNGAVLMMDEVHSLYRPLATQAEEHLKLLGFLLGDDACHRRAKVLILTASPGSTQDELVKLLNLVRHRSRPPIRVPEDTVAGLTAFQKQTVGLVSYINSGGDNSRFPTKSTEDVLVPLSPRQFEAYWKALRTTGERDSDYEALAAKRNTGQFWKAARERANCMLNDGVHRPSEERCAKMAALVRAVQKTRDQKHYVYSSFWRRFAKSPGYGVRALADLMEAAGYERLTAAQAQAHKAAGTLPGKGRRFASLVSSDLKREGASEAAQMASLENVRYVFNSDANAHGALLHVLLASQNFNESLDLKAVRHVHLLEPLVSLYSEKQAVGRAVRNCSHRQLDRDGGEWTVQVHRYIMTPPVGLRDEDLEALRPRPPAPEAMRGAPPAMVRLMDPRTSSIDEFVADNAVTVAGRMRRLEEAMRDAAIDCLAVKRATGSNAACYGHTAIGA